MLRKAVVVIFFLLLALVFGAVFVCDRLYFVPHREDIKILLDHADYENRLPPKIVKQLIDSSFQNNASLSSSVAKLFLYRYRDNGAQDKVLIITAKQIVWRALVLLHFQRDDLYSYYCILSFNGADYGANELSKRFYNKPLSTLSAEEAATIIATLWYPSSSQSSMERVNDYRDILLKRLRSQ